MQSDITIPTASPHTPQARILGLFLSPLNGHTQSMSRDWVCSWRPQVKADAHNPEHPDERLWKGWNVRYCARAV